MGKRNFESFQRPTISWWMGCSDNLVLVFLVLSSLLPSVKLDDTAGSYNWMISLAELRKEESNGNSELRVIQDVSCNSKECKNIYARIRAVHEAHLHEKDELSRVTPGMQPRVLIKSRTGARETLLITDTLVVESSHCMCLQNMTFKWSDSSAGSNACLFGTKVCEEVFLAPVPLLKETTSVQILIESFKTSMHIPNKRIKYNNIRQLSLLYSQWPLDNTTVNQPKSIAQLKTMPSFTNVWSMKIGPQVILTSNEFETHRVTKFEVNKNIFPEICSNWTEDVRDMLSLPDRLVIASKYGVMQYLSADNGPSFSNVGLLLPRCVISLDTISQSHKSGYHVTALTNDSSTFFFAKVITGISIDLKEAKSQDNLTLCEELAKRGYQGCRIISIGSTYSKPNKLFILVKSDRHLFVEYSVNSKLLAVSYVISESQLRYSKFSSFLKADSYNLMGMSFSQLHADHLFIWGNALIYSPNAGRTTLMLSHLKDDFITILTTSHQGDFAFITKKRKVFFGKVGTDSLRQLRLLEVHEVLTMFFDSSGDLFQLSLRNNKCNKSNCIQKIKILLRDALHRENLYLKTATRRARSATDPQKKCNNQLRNSKPGRTKIERMCPFAKITVRSQDFQRFARISLKLYCRNRLATKYATKLIQVDSSLFWTENIKAGSDPFKNCLWEDSSYDNHRLPEEISLGLGVCYLLEIILYFDHPDFADVYFHNFKIDDLKLSVSSSKPKDLLIDVNRTVNYVTDRVHFKINLCDSGLGRTQKPPGTGQEIVSTEIKVVGAGLNCIANSYKDSTDTQGYFTTRVLLGCPAGQKVVFNSKLAKATRKHYCVDENANVPCFHFDREFLPIFIHVDEATLKAKKFSGRYTLVIVAGGKTLKSIRNYTLDEQHQFNFQTGSSLIWAPNHNYVGTPVFTASRSQLRWLCSSNSPCSGIAPVFPHPPVYYFIIEFSNRKVDSSNCDFTFRFTIKIVGIQPGSINPSLIIVLVWIGLTILIVLASFFVRQRYGHVLDQIQWRNILRGILMKSSQPQPVEGEDTSNKEAVVMEDSNEETMGSL